MKPSTSLLLINLFVTILSPSIVLADDPFLNVDFNSGSSPTESDPPGFSAFTISGTPGSKSLPFSTPALFTSGITTITLSSSAGNLDSRDRSAPSDSGSFLFGELYRDFATTFDNDRTLQIQISGLNPNTQFSITFYAYDSGTSSLSDTFLNTTVGPQPSTSGVITQSSSSISSNNQFALTMYAISDASGIITFSETPSAGTSPRLNALQIAVPELSSISLNIAMAGSGILVSWPTNGGYGYILESAISLPTPSWTAVTNVRVVTGDYFITTVNSTNSQQFFRLCKP